MSARNGLMEGRMQIALQTCVARTAGTFVDKAALTKGCRICCDRAGLQLQLACSPHPVTAGACVLERAALSKCVLQSSYTATSPFA